MPSMVGSDMNDISLLEQWTGHIVPRSFAPGFVVLSALVSFIGAWTTLELVNRRTAGRGLYNWFLLIGSSISMGGVAIWCMHYVGNRAVILGSGQPILQISYNPGFTALSFFVPIIVLLAAFMAVGSDEKVSVIRIGTGGFLAGLAICGMHYLGQAGISNYTPVYMISYVAGSAVVAIVASVTALTVFFALRATWTSSWWKRAGASVILSGGVSGMHWVATVGTDYRLRKVDTSLRRSTRKQTVVVVIVLSVTSCLTLLAFTLIAQNRRSRIANRAQQVVLSCAIFDKDGKLMVTPEGQLPSEKITNTYVERSFDDVFGISHPVFLWIFRTSRSWNSVSSLIPAMRRNLQHAAEDKGTRPGTKSEVNLTNDQGEPIEDYSVLFRELFCVAAADLAERINEPVDNIGVLFDEIIATGQKTKLLSRQNRKSKTPESSMDIERDNISTKVFGRGQLLFLTRRANRRQVDHFLARGFRFASINNVVEILARSMQVEVNDLSHHLAVMQEYSNESHILEPGVHLACFAIRASVRGGFDVLVRRDARNQLPTMQMPIAKLEAWQLEYLLNLDGLTVAQCLKWTRLRSSTRSAARDETIFASQLFDTLEALKEEINDPFFLEAICVAKAVEAPCKGLGADSRPGNAQVIAFRLIAPIHSRAPGLKLEFIPFNFVRMQQHVYKNSPDHGVWARNVHREFGPILNSGCSPDINRNASKTSRGISVAPRRLFGKRVCMGKGSDDIPLTSLGRRTLGRETLDSSSEKDTVEQPSFGGIMVSQEVSVEVQDLGAKPKTAVSEQSDVEMDLLGHSETSISTGRLVVYPSSRKNSKGGITGGMGLGEIEPHHHDPDICLGTSSGATKEVEDPDTFVDRLFAVCVDNR